ncbi:unnamed protein product [Eruca vesicaria subsp. sativa]|uniref:SPARK domain-containing protein n=1 Tax=Eruca vesicaria subsp. sativa TaxID=29727 RepID=A0ABC8LMY8_ERUVS|nr:unnamed protein product [Eruca vesicaria subsp. sativa]
MQNRTQDLGLVVIWSVPSYSGTVRICLICILLCKGSLFSCSHSPQSFVIQQLPLPTEAVCPLELTSSNITLVASVYSNNTKRAKCCRYMKSFVAVSVSLSANYTEDLGLKPGLTDICITSISRTMELYGIQTNASVD